MIRKGIKKVWNLVALTDFVWVKTLAEQKEVRWVVQRD